MKFYTKESVLELLRKTDFPEYIDLYMSKIIRTLSSFLVIFRLPYVKGFSLPGHISLKTSSAKVDEISQGKQI